MDDCRFFIAAINKVEKDPRLKASHVSLFVSLLNCWSENGFKGPLKISQKQIALSGKIKSKATYHKCMKELHQFSYINYSPSYNPDGSTIYIERFEDDLHANPIGNTFQLHISIELKNLH